jgi:hypothetical protein
MMSCGTENITPSQSQVVWQDEEVWLQVRSSVQQICTRLGNQNIAIKAVAEDIAAGYAAVDPELELLCGQTCICCLDVCCLKATVWYDLRDLLFLYLSSGRLPIAQIHRNFDNSCSHLSSSGCVLARPERPFICTWYICHMQKTVLATQAENDCAKSLSQKIGDIQVKRKLLEDMCVSAVTPG